MCIRDRYKTVVTAAISEDAAYRNACGHSDRENVVIEGNAAVRRAVLASKVISIISPDGKKDYQKKPKTEVASDIVDEMEKLWK